MDASIDSLTCADIEGHDPIKSGKTTTIMASCVGTEFTNVAKKASYAHAERERETAKLHATSDVIPVISSCSNQIDRTGTRALDASEGDHD